MITFKNTIQKGLEAFRKKTSDAFNEGMKLFGKKTDKSMRTKAPMPPVLTTYLRETLSTYHNGRKITSGKQGAGNPNIIPFRARKDTRVEVAHTYNGPYARRQYYHEGKWGERSIADGRVENRFIEKQYDRYGENIYKDTVVATIKKTMK